MRQKNPGGRPAKARDDMQDFVIAVRVTAAEQAEIKAAANDRNTSMSAYLRGLGLRHRRQRVVVAATDLLRIAGRLEEIANQAPAAVRGELTTIAQVIGAMVGER
jgi:hypothetical protein